MAVGELGRNFTGRKGLAMMKRLYWILVVLWIMCGGIVLPQGALAATVTDSASNDNTTATANRMNVGDTVQGTISETDDLDYYTFTLDSAGCVTLDMTSYMEYYRIRIYDIDGEEIWDSEGKEWVENVGYCRETHDLFLEKGTYYMKITGDGPYSWNHGMGTYKCITSFVSSQITNVESDNTFSTANYIAMGNAFVGQISENDNHDTYCFELSQSGCVSFGITSYMRYYRMFVYDMDGKELWGSGGKEWTESVGYRKDAYDLYLGKGTYYIEVYGDGSYSWEHSRGRYVVNTDFASSGTSFEGDDNSFATANRITSAKTYTGQISINDDFDTYRFEVASGGKIPITIRSYMKYYTVKLFDANGKEIWYSDYNGWNENVGYRKDTHYVVLSAGTYYIQVSANENATGKYKFSLSATAAKKLDKVENVRASQQGEGIDVDWDGVSDAQGYQVCYSTSKTFAGAKTANASSTHTTLNKLKSKKSYYIRVRAYVVANGKRIYGSYSKAVKQKFLSGIDTVKKPSKVGHVRVSRKKKTMALSWYTSSGAEGYQICYSTSKAFKRKKTVKTTSTYATLRRLKAKKKYYVKIRAYVVAYGKRVYGKYSKVVRK